MPGKKIKLRAILIDVTLDIKEAGPIAKRTIQRL